MKDVIEETETRIEVLEGAIETLQAIQNMVLNVQSNLRGQYGYSGISYNIVYPSKEETNTASQALRSAIKKLVVEKYDDERLLDSHKKEEAA